MKVKKKRGKTQKPVQKTRKEIRKDKRKQKKINKALYYEQKKKEPGKFVLNPDRNKTTSKHAKKVLPKDQKDELQKRLEREKKKQKQLENEMRKRRKTQLKEANEQEDREIKQLEKQLKLNKRKNKSVPKSFAADGLDYLLDFCNDENRKLAVETEKRLLGEEPDSDFDEDFAVATGSKKKERCDVNSDSRLSGEEDSLEEDFSDEEFENSDSEPPQKKNKKKLKATSSDDEFEFKIHPKKNKKREKVKEEEEDYLEEDFSDEEFENSVSESPQKNNKQKLKANSSDDESEESPLKILPKKNKKQEKVKDEYEDESLSEESDGSVSDMGDSEVEDDSDFPEDENFGSEISEDESQFESKKEEKKEKEDATWEDIYGRKRGKDGEVVIENKYIPPAARLKQLQDDSALSEKLSRLRKQLKGHLNRLAEHNMHTIASQIEELYMTNSRNDMNEMISKLMMESIVSPVMTPDRLVAEHMMLIAILHANVGTEVGAHFLLALVRKFDLMMGESQQVENKELDNVILMISHLYNFKVYGSQLLYEILGKLTERFTEKEIELILVILKTVGFLLRRDDPVALKELILRIQQKISGAKSENSRVQFMFDVLLAIKNNNMSKIPQYDVSHIEHLKKIMKTFLRKGNIVTQFNICLEDLLKVDERGRWWVVGSAWSGNNDLTKPLKSSKDSEKPMFSQQLLDLARKQRMNTDTRRNIFCILMTAEDYLDAFEKLHHLGLKDQQMREIIYVLIDCCLQEKNFNPYYAVLAQKFCDDDRKNKMTLQYSLWDKLKALDDYNVKQLTNLAKFCGHLFIEQGLPLSVLKVIEFGQLDKQTMRLLRQIVLGILLHESQEACLRVFERISLSSELKTFRDGLRLFISHFLIKHAESRTVSEKDMAMLKTRAELVERILLARGGRIVF